MQGGGKVHAKGRDARIVIVGGGAAGICAAWYLKQAGFTRVQVLEKSPRLGGKCRSLTVHSQSFDLGANYITSAYKRVRELAKHVDADMYVEKPGHVINLKSGEIQSILRAVLKNTSFFTLAWQSLRYLFKRWRLSRLLSPHAPGFAHVKHHPEIQGSFQEWLTRNGLEALIPMFKIPLTLMGYGDLDRIAAAYALTYMSLGTFKDLGMFAANLPLRCWPRRFTYGYGRLFERLAAEVDVLTGVDIKQIERGEDGVAVHYWLLEQQLEGKVSDPHKAEFDYLILACPQLPEVLSPMLVLTGEEQRIFGRVQINPFYVTTYFAAGTEKVSAVTFSLPQPPIGEPYVVTRQFPENDFISIYTRDDWQKPIGKEQILANNQRFLAEIGAADPDARPYSCDDWAYFPHFEPADVDAGYYSDLDALQGDPRTRTYYCGGLLGFELVETIAEQAHHLVQTHFA